MSRRQNKEKTKTQRRRANNKKPGKQFPHDAPIVGTQWTIPRGGCIVPDRLRTRLKYWINPVISLAVNTTGVQNFTPTAAQDIGGSLSGTMPPGFAELAALYRTYRVLGSKIKVEAINTSNNSAIRVGVLPVNHDPGLSPTPGWVTAAVEQKYSVSKMIAGTGSPVVKITNRMTTERIYGTSAVLTDDNFSSLVTGTPINNWFWIVYYYSFATIPVATPLILNIWIEIDIDFYDRAVLPRS